MLCVDCFVEEQVEEPAITVSAGYALCKRHLTRYVKRALDGLNRQTNSSNTSCAKYVTDNWDDVKEDTDGAVA